LLPCEKEEAACLPGEPGDGGRHPRVVLRDGESGRGRRLGGGHGHQHVPVLGEHGNGEQQERADGVGERRAAAAAVHADVHLLRVAASGHHVV
jgi:hypothetical protein